MQAQYAGSEEQKQLELKLLCNYPINLLPLPDYDRLIISVKHLADLRTTTVVGANHPCRRRLQSLKYADALTTTRLVEKSKRTL
jgi:hypothetical protein